MRLINADDLMNEINLTSFWDQNDYEMVKKIIDNAPTVEWKDIELMGYVNGEQITKIKPSKIEGHWINHYDDLFPEESTEECSICHQLQYIGNDDNYCPNCGARMKL